jgi:transposase
MFIRKTKTNTSSSGEAYLTYRLVESRRDGKKVFQRTLLNLGRNFTLPREDWSELCVRIDQILNGQKPLFPAGPAIEEQAQHVYSQLIALRSEVLPAGAAAVEDFQEVDVNSLQLAKSRSVGAEYVALEALKELGLPRVLESVGLNGRQQTAALGNIVGRMCEPRSELATWNWLQKKSAIGELLQFDFESMSLMQLYRASDCLLKHKATIESHLFEQVQNLFKLTPSVTLYHLTNTYFEGRAQNNSNAKRGRSKEKRSDCPLVTLGLTLDPSGFIRHSQVFDGNACEGITLEVMLKKLDAPKGALVIMDAGIATEKNIDWLIKHDYKYLVVSRSRKRDFDMEQARSFKSACGHEIYLQRTEEERADEIRICCWSQQSARKDEEINESIRRKYEAELQKLAEGLNKPRCTKKGDRVNERLGRLKQRFQRVGQHYRIEMTLDEEKDTVTAMQWHFEPSSNRKQTHPGVYTLRSNLLDWDDETLWRTYTMLTNLEAVFRSLKSELGMRAVYHRKESRCEGHLFITVLAYQAVQVIRHKLKERRIHLSWQSLRDILDVQRRVTITFKQKDGRTLHVRKSRIPEEELANIYKILNLDANPGGIRKMTI